MSVTADTIVPFWRSIVARDVGALTGVVAVVSALGIAQLHQDAKHDVQMRFGMAATSIAGTAAPSIDPALLAAVHTNDDVAGPAFQTLRGQLERIRAVNHLEEDQIYILRPEWEGWSFAVMLQPNPFVGDLYQPPTELMDLYLQVAETKSPVATGLYTDDHGTFISGLAPILDGNGQLVGLLHVDQDVAMVVAAVQKRTASLLGLAALLASTLIVGGLLTYYRLGHRVALLVQGTDAIRAENYEHRVPLQGRDELSLVATALNETMPRLRERFDMLKFLPRHTQDMIRTSEHVDLQVARRVSVAVLESDIRGFTSLSEQMSPEAVIGMLNVYIRAQAEIIDTHGGSIDKYMGDAVLAVFEGEDHGRRAFDAALAIQNAVARMNDEGAFERPVRIGVGVSEGEVVMGNMGSEQRMEHTVIGAVVNLAARLCSAALAGEVVVQASIAPEGVGGLPERIAVKGFHEPIPCVRIDTQDRQT
jgi:class 3 adenylate cyclase